MKSDSNEINNVKSIINLLSNKENDNKVVYISKNLSDIMTNVIRVEPELNETANEIRSIITNNQKNCNISIRKIAYLYNISAN